nr:immunoglobulin heavy chain junction region [Mus musculus]
CVRQDCDVDWSFDVW